jgi:hypothetical protein
MSDNRINGVQKWKHWHNWITDVTIELMMSKWNYWRNKWVTIELMMYKNEITDIIELAMRQLN